MDWHHPDWGVRRAWNDRATGTPDMDRFNEYLKGQVTELVKNYHPGVMWFDGQWEKPWTDDRARAMYAYLRGLDPELIINNRVGGGMGDYGTPEQTIPATGLGPGVDWESCMTLNDHWGYNSHDKNWKSVTTIIHNLVDCASKGGNYLLNVGPTAEGLIPAESVERLAKVGAWMKVNGESIYGTSASPFKSLAWGRCTRKGSRLYLHVFSRPGRWRSPRADEQHHRQRPPAGGPRHPPALDVPARTACGSRSPRRCPTPTTRSSWPRSRVRSSRS